MAVFMDRRFLIEASPILDDKQSWDAFLTIVSYYERKTLNKLLGSRSPEELIKLHAEYNLLDQLKKTRENAVNAKREYQPKSE